MSSDSFVTYLPDRSFDFGTYGFYTIARSSFLRRDGRVWTIWTITS